MKIKSNYILLGIYLCSSIGFAQIDSTQIDTIQNIEKTKKKISFKDPVDGAFDVSEFLLEHNGVLPVIIPITEPAVGYGGGAALLYFHKRKKKYKTYVSPDVSGIVGLYTENKTWGAGGFHAHTFGENRVRTITAVMKPNVNIKYYGNNSEILANNPIEISLNSWLFYQKVQARISNTNFYVGGAYMFFNTDLVFEEIPNKPIISYLLSKLNRNETISSLNPILTYDTKNNPFTPTKGIKAEVSLIYTAKWLGSDDNFNTLKADFFGYVPITDKLNSKYRFQSSFLLGDAPFYAKPFIDLRGIAAMRYQDKTTMVAETEWSYNVYKRWWVTGFGGTGKAFPNFNEFNDTEWVYNVGTGFRYRLARLLGVDMGTDFAWGNAKDFAFYIVFGGSW